MRPTIDDLKQKLQAELNPTHLSVVDESYAHADHNEAAKDGGTHFFIEIASDAFENTSRIARHRMVYDTLTTWITPQGIHALQLKTYTPQEWAKRT